MKEHWAEDCSHIKKRKILYSWGKKVKDLLKLCLRSIDEETKDNLGARSEPGQSATKTANDVDISTNRPQYMASVFKTS